MFPASQIAYTQTKMYWLQTSLFFIPSWFGQVYGNYPKSCSSQSNETISLFILCVLRCKFTLLLFLSGWLHALFFLWIFSLALLCLVSVCNYLYVKLCLIIIKRTVRYFKKWYLNQLFGMNCSSEPILVVDSVPRQ